MRLLLDTHVLIWATSAVHNLSDTARSAIEDPDSDRWVSVVSVYEIEYKRDRDRELARVPVNLDAARPVLRFDWLDVDVVHAARAAHLSRSHKDPWYRLIAAQAIEEGLTIISRDAELSALGARVLW